MQGLMQDHPLTLTHFFDRAEKLFPDKEVVTASATGRERLSYGAWADRTRRLGGVLDTLGLSDDGRVGTFGWNTARHLELYFAAPCSGRVSHTLNIRLFPEQLTYIANHAEDEVIFVDRSLTKLLWPLLDTFKTVRHIVVMDDGAGDRPDDAGAGKELHDYEELLAAAEPVEFEVTDENRAASMCYTSGTTGNPKGVVYSHRSTWLHTIAVMTADSLAVSERDVILPVVPMFHANAWGLAHACVAAGASLVMPGPDLSAKAIATLIEEERVTVAAGVPTIWMGVLGELDGRDTSSLRATICGGSAVPKALSEGYRAKIGLPILQGWGMTETSPLASVGRIKSTLTGLSQEEQADIRTAIGLPSIGVEARVLDLASMEPVAHDGVASGELQVRGPWVAREYYNDDRSPQSFADDGWLKTGDVASVDAEGYMRIVDRTKDVVKSGGEWISTVELENELMGHPKVAEAA
ncbi:MAG: long-chain-fatty-acid--CoA ligase, partial [Acidimicrobiales bacterium]